MKITHVYVYFLKVSSKFTKLSNRILILKIQRDERALTPAYSVNYVYNNSCCRSPIQSFPNGFFFFTVSRHLKHSKNAPSPEAEVRTEPGPANYFTFIDSKYVDWSRLSLGFASWSEKNGVLWRQKDWDSSIVILLDHRSKSHQSVVSLFLSFKSTQVYQHRHSRAGGNLLQSALQQEEVNFNLVLKSKQQQMKTALKSPL